MCLLADSVEVAGALDYKFAVCVCLLADSAEVAGALDRELPDRDRHGDRRVDHRDLHRVHRALQVHRHQGLYPSPYYTSACIHHTLSTRHANVHITKI